MKGPYGGYTREELLDALVWSWATTYTGTVLHCVADIVRPHPLGWVGGVGSTVCGLRDKPLAMPGLFSRMGMFRCRRCCRKLGWPEGIGSSKNDPELRPLVEARLGP